LTGDTTPHSTIITELPETTWMERKIDWYACLVGFSFGAALSMAVFAVWLGTAHTLQFDADWWLIVGIWTGLVGFIDAFVLRNMGYRQSCILDEKMQLLEEQNLELSSLLARLGLEDCLQGVKSKENRCARISRWFVITTAKWYVLVGAIGVVILVLSIATALRWSETGQLIANTPTMIIEGFLLLVLIQAHNIAIVKRKSEFDAILKRREVLYNMLRGLG
jgi:low-affinity ferrous iron transport protein